MEQKNNNEKNPTVHNTHQEATLYVDYEQSIQTGYCNRYRTVNNQLFSGNTVCRVIAQRQKGE